MDRYDWQSEPEPEQESTAIVGAKLHIPASVLPDAPDAPDELDEVERRLEKAMYYKMLLKHQLITSDSDEAIEVENEIQDFVRERLSVLLGIKPERQFGIDIGDMGIMLKQAQPFSDEEVEALKAVAAKVLKKPTIVQASGPAAKPEPTIKPLEEPRPTPVRPAPVVEAPKPIAVAPPVKRGRGRPRKHPVAAPTPAPVQKSEPAPQNEETGPEEIRVIGAKRYKVVKRVVNDPANGQAKLDSNGNKIYAEHLIDVTPKVQIPGKQSFPSIEVMNAMEAAKAAEVLSTNPIAAGLIPTAMTLPDTTNE